jgi:hypothetical protein
LERRFISCSEWVAFWNSRYLYWLRKQPESSDRRWYAAQGLSFALGVTNSAFQTIEEIDEPAKSPKLAVTVSASFPSAEIFGIKLVNGKPTQALLSFTNEETEAVTVNFIGGSLWTTDFDPQGSRIVRNLTTTQYNVEIPAGEKQSLAYAFATEIHPQELRLNLATILSDVNGDYYTVQAFNETVSVVEQDTSIFDPQM